MRPKRREWSLRLAWCMLEGEGCACEEGEGEDLVTHCGGLAVETLESLWDVDL